MCHTVAIFHPVKTGYLVPATLNKDLLNFMGIHFTGYFFTMMGVGGYSQIKKGLSII
jgi:hypothetical protein